MVEVREVDTPVVEARVVEARVAEARRPDRTVVDTRLFHLPATAPPLSYKDERILLLPRRDGYFSASATP